MPEGDTIFRTARTLHQALAGKTVTRFETMLPLLARVDDQQPLSGRRVERVVAAGKNLIIDFSGGLHLRTHMRMNGSWHIYRPNERWQRRRSDMRIVIATDDWIAVGFNIHVAEFHDDRGIERQEDLRRIGPDLLDPNFAEDEAVRRIRARGDSEIANALLNQRVVAGIGNIYKSEALFVAGVNPFALVASLTDDQLRAIVAAARKLLMHSAKADRRVERWVYEQNVCRRCKSVIEYRKQGQDARGTHWCPSCQGLGVRG